MRILIIDNSQAIRAALTGLLVKSGHEVVAALADGSEMSAVIAGAKPDVICLDHHLPGKDGLTLLKEIQVSYPDIAVIFITASKDTALQGIATAAGAWGVLSKPFSQEAILEELKNVFETLTCMRELPSRASSPISPDVKGSTLLKNASTAKSSLSGKRVVIADDSSSLRQLLKGILIDSELVIVAEAGNGKDAVSAAIGMQPDVVFLDVEMPVMSGLEALVQIREKMPKLPVMMVTGNVSRDVVEKAKAAGAQGYIVKPFKPARIIEALQRLFATT